MSPDDFHAPTDFTAAADLLRTMITGRKLVKEMLVEESVAAAFNLVGATAKNGEDGGRLEAVSILGKASEVSKPVAKLVQPLLRQALLAPMPHTGSWGSAEDRYYLAKGVLGCEAPWVPHYAAVELARGDVNERLSRGVWAEIAIGRAETLAELLRTVADALSDDVRSVGSSVDTACRKLNRITAALRNPMSISDLPIGEGFGRAFSDLVSQAGGPHGPDVRHLRDETANEVLNFMVQVLRLKFAATLDSDVYRAADVVLGWWKPAHPPKSVTGHTERIALIAMDALHLFARQGVAQRNLRQALVDAFGTEEVNRIGAKITSHDPSLDPAIASWLCSGKELAQSRANPAVREINEQAFDELVAKLLLAVNQQESGPDTLGLIADQIEVLEPAHAAAIRASATHARLVRQWAQAIGKSRGLILSGEPGELVQYDPAIHDSENDMQIAARARIKMPAVIKQSGERPKTIVLKAFVQRP